MASPGDPRVRDFLAAARYVGAERAGDFGRRNGVPGELVVRLRPVRVLANFDVTD